MKVILSILNILSLSFLTYIISKGVYIDFIIYLVFGLSITLFFLAKGQWIKSGFIVISIIFNPLQPILLTKTINLVMSIIFILYNFYYIYRIRKLKEI